MFGLSRIYEMLSDRGPLPIRTFRDLGAANAWLGIEPDERIHGSDALRLVFSGLMAT